MSEPAVRVLEAFFLISVACILWMFFGYPVFLAILSSFRKRARLYSDSDFPSVSLIVVAYNEEKVIERKMQNMMDLDYPEDLKEIIVVDDGSTDKTAEIVARYLGPRIKLVRRTARGGKPQGIKVGLEQASGEIILVTDANSFFEKNAVKTLVRNFSDSKVMGVGGKFEPYVKGDEGVGLIDKLYWRFENFLKERESVMDSIIGMNGNIAAIRRNVLEKISLKDDSIVEDFELTVCIRKMGFRVVFEPEAYSWKLAPKGVKEGIIQKRRRSVGTIQTLIWHKDMLFNPKYGLYGALILPSHKLLPMLCPFFTVLGCATLTFLHFFSNSIIFHILFYLMLSALIWLCIATFLSLSKPNFKHKMILLPKYFLVLQASIIMAWVDYFLKTYSVTWRKAETTREID
ncbi:MAG: glycosyltransferase [Candidatus Bathyarchaeia archaeon]